MDAQSMEMMRKFASKLSDGNVFSSAMSVLDVGALDVNGAYRDLFPSPKFMYMGMDIVHGKNVDIVVKDPHKYTEVADSGWDVVISGQALEHVEDIYAVADEMIRVLKPNGLMCIIVPCSWEEHRFPIDCWRFYPDGLRWLFVKRHPLTMEEVAIGTQGRLAIAVLRKI